MQKNVAGQKWIVFAFNRTDNTPLTGDAANITANLRIDGGAANAVDDTNPTELEDGYYIFDITQTESDGENIVIAPVSSTSDIQVIGVPGTVYTTPANFPDLSVAASTGRTAADMVSVSGDTVAADNLEAMYDGTGYEDETAPASRSQVSNIGAGGGGAFPFAMTEDNTGGAIDPSAAVFVGSVQGATTFANLEAADGIVHDIDDVGDDIDIVYGTNVGGSRTAVQIKLIANVSGNTDEIKIKAYDHVGADWEIIGTVEGSGGGAFVTEDPILLPKHVGTGAELGKVYIRLETDSTTPSNISIDQLVVFATNIGQSVGYANGQIWINTTGGEAGTVPFTHGVADNQVDLLASAKTLGSSVGLSDFHLINGSSILLVESTVNESYFGDNWTLALGGQNVAGAYFQGAHVSGVGLSTAEVHFEGCDVGTTSVQKGHFDFCSFDGTVTHTLAGDYNYHNCYSKVPGVGGPTFTKTPGQTITAQWRNWAGTITVSNVEAGDVMTISGMELGDIVLNGVDGTIKILGEYESLTDNRTGGSVVLVLGAFEGSDVADILADTGTDGVVVAASSKAGYSLAATGLDLVLSTATGIVAIAKGVWDRVISMANHNIGQSAGKVLRLSGDLIQVDGAVSDASPTTTDFDTDLTEIDTYFADAVMIFVNGAANAGIGKPILTYVNASGHVTFEADTPWPVTPVNGDDFVIVALHAHPISEIQAGLATEAKQDINTTHLTEIKGSGFDESTDSNEAIRNRGDAAWITGGGGGITDIINIQPLMPPSIDLADTATVRLGLMLFNSLDDLPSTVEITPGTISIDRKAIGGTSWTSIVSDAACSEIAGLIYYDEVFDSGAGYAEGDTIRITLKGQKVTVAANDYEIIGATGRMFYTEIRQTMRGTNSGATAAALATVDSNVDAIKVVTDTQARASASIADGAAEAGTLSTTEMTTDLTVGVLDQLKGRQLIFAADTTTANLRKQATDITGVAVSGSKLTFTALTTAPVAGDTFSIV